MALTTHSQHSNMLNQARLRVLKSRDDNISDILDEAKGRLGEVTKDAARWRGMLGDLITQVTKNGRGLLVSGLMYYDDHDQ